jgi:hypothetical protein
MCITTSEALFTIKKLITEDIEECCEASMDKGDVVQGLEKLMKYIEKIDRKENPIDLNSPLNGYY